MNRFTDTFIKGEKPSLKIRELYEGDGFGFRITPNGIKTFFYRYKIDGKRAKVTIGRYPQVTLAAARKRFAELSAMRKVGLNPIKVIEQQEQKKNDTVGKLILDWYKNYAEKHLKKPLHIKQQIDADIIPLIGDLLLDKIQTRDITKALDIIVSRGAPIHANRVLSTIKQAFNYGASRGTLQHNVAVNIRARDIGGIEKPKERYLTLKEIKKVWDFLGSEKNLMSSHLANAIKILLLTGVRTAELRLATWGEFDFEKSLWTIPAAHSKGGSIHMVHLSEQVKDLLYEMKSEGDSQYLLPKLEDDKPIAEQALPRAVNRIQERIGIPKWTPHDCRRTFSTHLSETLRVDAVVIEKLLSHKLPRIMATYNKNEMLHERKEALDKWGQYIENLVCFSNVILFEQAV